MRLFQRSESSSENTAPAPKVSFETLAEMAKHLRQLNFYFLLVCVALLLAIYLPRDTTLDKAAEQLREVIRFQSDVGDEQLWEIAGSSPPAWAGHREPYAAILFPRPNANSSANQKQHVCFVYENEILQGNWMVFGDQQITDFRQVETHEEFAHLWNSLARNDAYLRILEYGTFAYYTSPGEQGIDTSRAIPIEVVTTPSEVNKLFQLAFAAEGNDNLTPSIAEWIACDQAIAGKHYDRGIRLSRSMAMFGGDDAIVLPIAVEPAKLPILNRLFERTDTKFEYLAANHYDLVHRELSDWTLGNKVDRLGLYAMRSVLEQLRVTQSEKFEIFGFGIPYEFLFQYGLLVLVTFEIFFWGNLRSFRILADSQQRAVWAPWLPLYPDRISRLLTIGSIVVFPTLVIARLVIATEFRTSSMMIGLAGVVVACSILVEFVRHWRTSSLRRVTPISLPKAA